MANTSARKKDKTLVALCLANKRLYPNAILINILTKESLRNIVKTGRTLAALKTTGDATISTSAKYSDYSCFVHRTSARNVHKTFRIS